MRFFNNISGFINFLQLLFSIIVFIIVYVWYNHKEHKLNWNVSYIPGGQQQSLIRIISTSGDKAKGIIRLDNVIYKNHDGESYKVNKKLFKGLSMKLPTVISDGYRIINIVLTNEEINDALKKCYVKIHHHDIDINKGFGIEGSLIFYFKDNENNERHLSIGEAYVQIPELKAK